jgi:hypothetical protein
LLGWRLAVTELANASCFSCHPLPVVLALVR